MTIKNIYPSQRPDIIYNVINGREELPVNAEFSRTSEASYVDANGFIQIAAAGVPRYDHDPVTLELNGLRLEPQQTNLCPSSEFGDETKITLAEGGYLTQDMGLLGSAVKTCYLENEGPPNDIGASVSFTIKEVDQPFFSLFSCYVKKPDGPPEYRDPNVVSTVDFDDVDFLFAATGTRSTILKYLDPIKVGKDIYYCSVVVRKDAGATNRNFVIFRFPFTKPQAIYPSWFTAFSVVEIPDREVINIRQSYIKTINATVTREADQLALTSPKNFDPGFSLLLDSETTTREKLYSISDTSDNEIAYLKNDNGTLEWNVNGTSAQSNGDYPQVGFTLGRVRTISSFTAAGDNLNPNYLYTTGLSFPTVAAAGPGAGANKLTFGTPQTLKALYIWPGQLASSEAVALIKGDDNVIPNINIDADAYSFVYNTDPENIGETSISLPYIVPTAVSAGMTINWGDGTPAEPYNKGVVPAHTYPYPGQYRIQINAEPGGFDQVTLGKDPTPVDSITRLDAWPPQFRAGAAGDGFTGDDMVNMLGNQRTFNSTIPPFKYKDLTSLSGAFSVMRDMDPGNWDYVPYLLPECVNLKNAFSYSGYSLPQNDPQKETFPQLKTSSKLSSVERCFTWTGVTGWINTDTAASTYQPFTNTSQVVNWDYCFYAYKGTNLELDLAAGTSFESTFRNCNQWEKFPPGEADVNCMNNAKNLTNCWTGNNKITSFPPMIFTDAETLDGAWEGCTALTSFPLIEAPSGTSFKRTWQDCENLENFPLIDFSKCESFDSTWNGCSSLISFVAIDVSSASNLRYTWSGCNNLASFPLIDTSNIVSVKAAWRYCFSLTSFPLINTSNCTDFARAWRECRELTSFPVLDTSKGEFFDYTWHRCENLTSFPALNLSSGSDFREAWANCVALTTFPADMFNTTGPLIGAAFNNAFANCALTPESIENILVSLDANGASNIELALDGGTNAAKPNWTNAANTAYDNLIAKGWTISFNN